MTSRGFDFGSPREIAPLTHEPTARGCDGGVRQELAARVITFRSGATRIGLLCPSASRAA